MFAPPYPDDVGAGSAPPLEAIEQADLLIRMANRNRLVLNVGHVERFNPAVCALFDYLDRPQLIEARRLSPLRYGGNSSNVVLDLMIHDLDLILQAMDDQVRWIDVDIWRSPVGLGNHIKAHLEFQGGSSASVVAGYVSAHIERTMKVIQHDSSMEVDLYHGTLARLMPTKGPEANSRHAANNVIQRYGVVGSLLAQIESFVRSVVKKSTCLKSANMARQALETALTISKMVDSGLSCMGREVDATRILP